MSLDIPVIDFYPFLNGTDEDREKVSLEIEKLSPKGDLKEDFDLAMELPADDKDRIERGAILYGPNFWPDNLHGFRECIYSEFYLKMLSLGKKLFEAFALSLNLPSNYFKSMCQKPMVTMRLLHYPPQTII
ncbi:unnamed protein product [Rotaria socialis]|uniref:Uncharacterized protein n=1 Tax=Rotaria socialis TaxID=392032 RepID=A0A820HF71_9BILA|nr:unnamed protein product [Rotaria socialis]CAF3498603.1 unnamed protein product [Rotaria socialis]CAF4295147.1 unnamed protein product [Rotaria socialis]CAF4501816.1 unnamed protein product [Rotaria socialis]